MNLTMKCLFKWAALVVAILVLVSFASGLWAASNQLLAPSWRGVEKDLSVCKPETEKYWGLHCANLRETQQFKFSEVRIPLADSITLPGWLVTREPNGMGQTRGVILLVHPGGSDRRDETRYIAFYLGQGLDVLTFDYECHGDAPCPVFGLSYGERESRDVAAAYSYLEKSYDHIYAFGSSVGAAAVLMAFPAMPNLRGAIAENPYYDFERLIKEAPQAQSMPGWFSDILINFSMWRGSFGNASPAAVLSREKRGVPILFIHSKEDEIVSHSQTQELANLYGGPKVMWFPDKGGHAAIWDVNKDEYEQRVSEFVSGATGQNIRNANHIAVK
jgi:uncharacterized protein